MDDRIAPFFQWDRFSLLRVGGLQGKGDQFIQGSDIVQDKSSRHGGVTAQYTQEVGCF